MAKAKAKAKSSCQAKMSPASKVKSCWCCESNVLNALYKGDRFMIRLAAKFDLAAPEADSEVESDEYFGLYLMPLASSQVCNASSQLSIWMGM